MTVHTRYLVVASVALTAILTLTACTGNASETRNRSIPTGLTASSLCDVAKSTLASAALPDVSLADPQKTDQDSSHECLIYSAKVPHQLVKLAVSYTGSSIHNSIAINKELANGSKNSKQSCPGGASLPALSAGLPAETTLICNEKAVSMVEYSGQIKTTSIAIRVERDISKGQISSDEAQGWVNDVALKLLVSSAPSPSSSPGAGTSSNLDAIAHAWRGPAVPEGWQAVGPQPKIRTIGSIYSVFGTIAGDACREITSGILILASDKSSAASIVVLEALGSTTGGSQSPAQLAAAARVFDSHQEAENWLGNMNALVTQCTSIENIAPGFFTENSSTMIRWSGDALRAQSSAGFITVIGNTVFTGSADADSVVFSQADQEGWVTAIETSAQASVE